MRLEEKLRHEVEKLTFEIGDIKLTRQIALRQNVVACLVGKLDGLRLALMICIFEMESRTVDPKTKKEL